MSARYDSLRSSTTTPQRGISGADSPGLTPTRKPRRQWQVDTSETDVSAKKLLAARPDSPAAGGALNTPTKGAGDDLARVQALSASVDSWLPSGKLVESDDSDTLLSAKKERGRKPLAEVRSSMPALSSTRCRRHCLACKHAGAAAAATSRACASPTPGAPSSRCTCGRAPTTTTASKGAAPNPPPATAGKAPSRLKPAQGPKAPQTPEPPPQPPAAPDLQAVIDHLLTPGQATPSKQQQQQEQEQEQRAAGTGSGSQSRHAAEMAGALAHMQGAQSAAAEAAATALQSYLAAGRMLEALEKLRGLQQRHEAGLPAHPPPKLAIKFTSVVHPALVACALALPPSLPAPLAPSTPNPPSRRPIPLLTQLTSPPPSAPSSPPASPSSPPASPRARPRSSTPFESPCSSLSSASSVSDSHTLSRSHSLGTSYSVTSQSATTPSSSATTPFLTPDATPPATTPSTLTPQPSISPALLHTSSSPLPPVPLPPCSATSILESAEAWFLELVEEGLCEAVWVRTSSDCASLLGALIQVQDWVNEKLAGTRGPVASESARRRLQAAAAQVQEGFIRWGKERVPLPKGGA